MIMVYYSKRTHIKVSQGQRLLEQSPREFHKWSFQLSPPSGVKDSANIFQQQQVMTYREAPLRLGVQRLYWGSVTST